MYKNGREQNEVIQREEMKNYKNTQHLNYE